MKFVPIELDKKYKDLGLDCHSDLMNDINMRMAENLSRKREEQIIEALKKRGYAFQNKEQLYEFAKRCELRSYEERPDIKELWYENELVCMYSEKITTEFNNNDFKSTITVTVG